MLTGFFCKLITTPAPIIHFDNENEEEEEEEEDDEERE